MRRTNVRINSLLAMETGQKERISAVVPKSFCLFDKEGAMPAALSCFPCAGDYAGWIASDGQTSAQVPQSVHTSGSIW